MGDTRSVYSLSRSYVADERDELVNAIMNLSTGEVFKLENSAKDILYSLIHGHTSEEIVGNLLELYDVERALVLHDVETILAQFLSMGVLDQKSVNTDDSR